MRHFSIVLGCALLAAAPVWGADEPQDRDEAPGGRVERPLHEKHPFWIGAMCVPADDVLCAQLKIKSGLVVLSVVPSSPADEAGMRQYDVLTTIGDKQLQSVVDLADAVNAADGKELKLQLRRGGETETLTVHPAKRPAGNVFIPRHGPGGLGNIPPGQADRLMQNLPEGEARRLQEWLEQMQRGERQPLRMQVFGPGVVMQRMHFGGPLPAGVKVLVSKNGNEPATIHVERGDEKWDVKENELEKLPEDLRGPIGAMLGGGAATATAVAVTGDGAGPADVKIKINGVEVPNPNAPGGPQAFTVPLPPGFNPQAAAELEALKKQVERLERKVDDLLKAKAEPAAKGPVKKPRTKDET